MIKRLLIVSLLLFLFKPGELRAQLIADYLIKGADWRMCGSHQDKDTLRFFRYDAKVKGTQCFQQTYTQLLTYSPNEFRILNWTNGACNINEPGTFEANDSNGTIRFYFDDGSSRDYLMLFLNKEKLVLVDLKY
ncbi:MAG TPA: hypothetical protein DEP18_06395 [Flavobacteriales bacterium]|nr:hypothetical protein [Flavobacteriales bacterium]HCA83400.1 hypothetical protein [Flavobacteriales bacterium]HRE74010.1 hypothetical protein [Flavobacteriales bacterium]HRE98676.1 hypothetical protein [Flavobacteriales bacterium]HRJ36488.1 hypothetical protein [Flavobacteriales bacterium]